MHHKKLIIIAVGAIVGFYLSQPDTTDVLDPILTPLPKALGTTGTTTQMVFAAEGAAIAYGLSRFVK